MTFQFASIFHLIHFHSKCNLHSVEYVLNRAIYWIVCCKKNTSVSSSMNHLLHYNVSVRIEIVHCKAISMCVNAFASVLQNSFSECQESYDYCTNFIPLTDPLTRWMHLSVIFSTYRKQNVELFTVAVLSYISHSSDQMSFPSTSVQ